MSTDNPLVMPVMTLLVSIDAAGGWHVFDPKDHDMIYRAMAETKAALIAEIERGRHGLCQ